MTARTGDIVLVQHQETPELDTTIPLPIIKWLEKHRTIEIPHSEAQILANKERGGLIKTYCICVGVPRGYLREVKYLWMYRAYYSLNLWFKRWLGTSE